MPLFSNFEEWSKKNPVLLSELYMQKFGIENSEDGLLKAEKIVIDWHEALWKYRSELIRNTPLVDMDDEVRKFCTSIRTRYPSYFISLH